MAWKSEKERILENMEKAVFKEVEEYNNNPEGIVKFGTPVFKYLDVKHPVFDEMYEKNICKHPKELFKPGYCAFIYYLPFAEDKTGDYESFYAAMRLCMTINKNVRAALNDYGRLSSLCSSMADWNKNACHYEWNPKIAAWLAGMGKFGPGGSFHTETGCSGRVGVVLFDKSYCEPAPEMTQEEVEAAIQKYYEECCFAEAKSVECSDELIAACPGGAISKNGIDRQKCQEHCMTINAALPDPELCGKCFK